MGNEEAAHAGPAEDRPQPPKHRGLKRLALAFGAVLLLLGAPIALIALVEFRIPMDWARPRLESLASAGTVLEIRVHGPLLLVTGPRPGFEARDVQVKVAGKTEVIEIARLGAAHARIEARALFAREVHVTRAEASDVTLRLGAASFAAMAAAGGTVEPKASSTPVASSEDGWRFVGVSTFQVERAHATIELPALAHPAEIGVDTLTLQAPEDSPLAIDASGTVAGETMQLEFRTSSLTKLAAGGHRVPLDLRIALADGSFTGKGTLDLSTQRGDYRVALEGHGRLLERILPGFKRGLGGVNDVSVEGRLRTAPEGTALEAMTLVAGRTRALGEYRQTIDNGRLHMQGRLEFEALDLTPWLPVIAAQEKQEAAQRDALDAIRGLQQKADVDLDIKAARLIWPKRKAEDVQIALRADQDRVALEGSASLLTGSLKAEVRLETAQPEARLLVNAQGGPILLESLHREVEAAGIAGLVRTAKLTARGQGKSMTALAHSIEGELELGDVDASWKPEKDGKPLRVKIKSAHLEATRDALQGSFAAAIEDADIALKLSSKRAAAESKRRLVRSNFDVTVKRARRRGARFQANGALTLDPKTWTVDVKDARLGRTRGAVTAKGTWDAKAPMSVRAAFRRFDTKAMDFFDFGRTRKTRKTKRWQDVVVLPRGVHLPPMDLDMTAKRLDIEPAVFKDVRVTARSRSGRLERAKFELRAKGGVLRGDLSADLRGKVPRLDARAKGKAFDARGVLALLGLKAERAQAQSLEVDAALRGARLKQIVAASVLRISTQGLDLAMPGLVDARRTLALRGAANATSTKGRLLVSISGTLNEHKFSARSRGPELAGLIARDEQVPVDIEITAADSTLAARGTVSTGPGADLRVQVSGKRLDTLLALGGLNTTVASAFSVSTRFGMTAKKRYSFDEIDAQIGESKLKGRILADLSAARPRIEAKLSSPALRPIDLGGGVAKETVGESRRAAEESREAAWLVALRRYDAKVDVEAERLFAAGEWLGPVRLKARVKAGRLQFDPLEIRSRSGSLFASGSIAVPLSGGAPTLTLRAKLKQFDLTPILRTVKPDAKGTAIMDTRAVLTSRGLGKAMLENLDGILDIATYGTDVGAGQLDLMGINLLSIAGNALDPSGGSKVNCGVGVFDLGKGMMKSRALFVDTTRMRIMGNLDVDLRSGALDGGLRPFPKNPALFRVSTPVDISGTIDEPSASLATSALPELILRFSNPYTIFLGSLVETRSSKEDGSDDCRTAFARAEEARSEVGGENADDNGASDSPLRKLEDLVTPKGDQ